MTNAEKPRISPDYLLRGALTKIGDTFDRLTGRRWKPSSTLAASELIERMKKLLDAEAKAVHGKGTVVPHNIQLKMQWDKFSTDSDSSIEILETELLTAAVDHLNDKLYYTYAPLRLSIKPDYFTDGVKMLVSFEDFGEEEREVEMNVTVPALNVKEALAEAGQLPQVAQFTVTAQFQLKGVLRSHVSELNAGGRLTVGRSAGNDLPLDDISVSRCTHRYRSETTGRWPWLIPVRRTAPLSTANGSHTEKRCRSTMRIPCDSAPSRFDFRPRGSNGRYN